MTDFLTQLVARTLGATCVVSPDLPQVLATNTGPDAPVVHGDPSAGASTPLARAPEAALDPGVSRPAPAAPVSMFRAHEPRAATAATGSHSPHEDWREHVEPTPAVPNHNVSASTPPVALEAWTPAVVERDPTRTVIVHHERATTERVTTAPGGARPVSRPRALRPVQVRVEREAVVCRQGVTDVEPPEQSTTVRISIGRIEVHAAPTLARDLGRRPAVPRPTIELDAYLTQRNGPRS